MIRSIIDLQFRCEHDFIVEEFELILPAEPRIDPGQIIEPIKTDELVYVRCKKCGYRTRHWKKGLD